MVFGSVNVERIQRLNPDLGLYQGQNNEVFGIGGYLINKNLSPKIIKEFSNLWVL